MVARNIDNRGTKRKSFRNW